MKISDIGERELVRRIKSLCNNGRGEDIIEGIGDDCAAYTPTPGFLQVVTIDALVEKSHFHFDYFPPKLLGRKAISVNLSDIAAMGAIPKYALVSLQLPKDFSLADIESLYEGMMEAASFYKLSIVGGNLTSSALFSLHMSLIGEVAKDSLVSRGG
ncbi:MAG: thiamine-phosphate kinase, partial [Nitrospinota bacterium]